MAALQPEKPVPDLEEERASTPLSLTCKEDYANATDCLSEGKSTSRDASSSVLASLLPSSSSSGSVSVQGVTNSTANCNSDGQPVEERESNGGGVSGSAVLTGPLKNYYTQQKSVLQATVKMERDNDEDSESFANFVAQELHVHSRLPEEENSSSVSSTSPIALPLMSELLVANSDSVASGSITNLCVPLDKDIAALKVPVEDCIATPLDMTSRNFPKRSKYAHRAAISAMHPYNRTRGGGVSIVKTLELLKAVLQTSFNQEVKRLCDDYLDIYNLATTNIYNNTGEVVPKETLRTLVCKMLDESGQCFQNSRYDLTSGKLPRNEKVTEKCGSPMAARKHKLDREVSHKRQIKKPKRIPMDKYERSVYRPPLLDKRKIVDPRKWQPEQITLDTLFVLGVNANKALGHGASRGKIYYAHPELFKYPADGNDKTWLYDNKHLPVHGGKAFLMFLDELKSMVESNQGYRDNDNVHVNEMEGFKLPAFLLEKIQHYIRSLQKHHVDRSVTDRDDMRPSSSKDFEVADEFFVPETV